MKEENSNTSKDTPKKTWESPRLTELETNLTEGKNTINSLEANATTGPS